MRDSCGETTVTGIVELASAGNKDVGRRLERLMGALNDGSENSKIMRTILGISNKGNSTTGLRNWILMRTNIDILSDKSDSLLAGDLNDLEVELQHAKDIISNLNPGVTPEQVRGTFKRWWRLPHETFRKRIPGGRDIWMDISTASAARNAMIENVGGEIETLLIQLNSIKSIAMSNSGDRMRRIQKDYGAAQTRFDVIRKGIRTGDRTFSNADLSVARQQLGAARDALYAARKGGSKGTDIATAFHADLVNAIEGKYGMPHKAASVLKAKYDKDIRVRDFVGLIGDVETFTNKYGELAKKANESAKRNLVSELTVLRGMKEAEARDLADELYDWAEEDNYFPRQNLLNGHLAQKAASRLRSTTSKHDVAMTMKAFRGGMAKRRKSKHGGKYSIDIPNVLKAYAEDVIYMDYANIVAETVNVWAGRLRDSTKTIARRDWHNYVEGSIKEVLSFANEMVYSRDANISDNAIKTLVSIKAAGTMGLPNLSTPLVNYVEGHLHTIAKAGLKRWVESKSMTGEEIKAYNKATEGHHVRMSAAGSYYGDEPKAGSLDHLRAHMTDGEIKLLMGIETSTAQRWSENMSKASSKVASGTLKLQRIAENANRASAFRVGANDELRAIHRLKKYFMEGDMPEEVLLKYGIDPGLLKKNQPWEGSDRQKAWDIFSKKRALRAGYEMVYGTQWQYDMAARHMFENWRPMDVPVGKALMMYQHYPINWMMAYKMFHERNMIVIKNGGFKSLFRKSTKDVDFGYVTNQQNMYQMTVGAMHLVNMAARYASPILLGSLASHPAMDMVAELIEYFSGDDDRKENAFFGKGLANQLTGPLYTDFTEDLMPIFTTAINSYLFDIGELPTQSREMLRLFSGVDWTDRGLEEQREASLFRNSLTGNIDAFLAHAHGAWPKTKALGKSLDDGMGPISYNVARQLGFYPNRQGRENLNKILGTNMDPGASGRHQQRKDDGTQYKY